MHNCTIYFVLFHSFWYNVIIMKHLNTKLFGLSLTTYDDLSIDGLPLFINDLYSIDKYSLLKCCFIAIEPKNDNINLSNLEKHLSIISNHYNLPVVTILKYISPYQRKTMIDKGVSFIYKDKQMYLPFLGLQLEEHFSSELTIKTHLSYLAQFVYLYLYYYFNNSKVRYIDITKYTNISKSNCTRAIQELSNNGLVNIEEKGREKYISINGDINKAIQLMRSPIQKIIYTDIINSNFAKSNMLALSLKTDIAEQDSDRYYAIDRKKYLSIKNKINSINIADEKAIKLEVWMYDPCVLSKSNIVDDISLILSLKQTDDIRINNATNTIKERNGITTYD